MECKPYKARDPRLLYDWCFFHNIRLYKVRIHFCCKKCQSSIRSWSSKTPIKYFFKLCICTFFQVIPISPPAGSTHVFVSFMRLPPSFWFEIVSDCFCTTRISSSLTCFPHFVSLFFFVHSFIVKIYVIKNIKSHQIIEKNLLSQQEKNSNGDRPFAKFKLTEQGQVYTLQTSTCLLLQTNPLPLQISNGENMKSLWVTKLKMIENQKGLALQSWI